MPLVSSPKEDRGLTDEGERNWEVPRVDELGGVALISENNRLRRVKHSVASD